MKREAAESQDAQIKRAFSLAFQRAPARDELAACACLAEHRGLAEVCRALLNLNEFIYVD